MIEIKVLASGSRGNCTALRSGSTTILLDAGIMYSTIREALDFKNPAAALITHEHGDHARLSTIRELLNRGVDLFMTAGTAEALNLTKHHRLHLISHGRTYLINNKFEFFSPNIVHDAAEPVGFEIIDHNDDRVHSDDYLSYVTDTGELPSRYDEQLSKLIIEANHSEGALQASNISANLKRRIWENHLSIEQVERFFRESYLPALREVHLIHVSKRHGDAAQFQRRVQAILPKVEVKAAW